VVRFPSERLGDSSYFAAVVEFSDFIFVQGLVDVLIVRGQFTWSNNQESKQGLETDFYYLRSVKNIFQR
jgi:hypothetical protein